MPLTDERSASGSATSFLRAIRAACAAFAPVAAVATFAVEAVPHARGIGFIPQLRFAVITPICLVVTSGGAVLYQCLESRSSHPRRTFGAFVVSGAAIAWLLLVVVGPAGLGGAAAPTVMATAVAVILVVPRFVAHPPRRFATSALMLIGVVALAGVVVALASERDVEPGPGGMAFEIPRQIFNADHRFIDLSNGARVHYVDEGAGQTLLFLHGNPAWSFQWRDLIAGLRSDFRCIALDYPGFGQSSAARGFGFTPLEQSRVVEEFVERLDLRDLTLVMQDWGGPIGLGLAARRPELVRRVVLGNTWAWETSIREPRGLFSKIVGGPIGEFAQMNFNAFAWAAIRQGVVRELPREVTDTYLRPFRPLDRRGVAAFYPGQITAASAYMREVEAGLGRLRDRHALIFWGMEDPGFPRADLERFERVFPNHKTIQLPKANHFFFEDAADRIVSEVRSFMRSAGNGETSGRRVG